MEYNWQLTQLYEKYKVKWSEERQQGKLSHDLLHRLSCPFLLHVENSLWDDSEYRILLVGQEPFGWDDGEGGVLQTMLDFLARPDSVHAMQKVYEGFNFGATYTVSPFWQAYREARRAAEADKPYAVMWSNLYRCCYDGGSVFKAGLAERQLLLEMSREIFVEELKILQPRAVIFATGPAYDETIEKIYPGTTFTGFSLKQNNQRQLARVVHQDLSQGKSYRVYHPNYLRRTDKWDLFRQILADIQQTAL